MSDLVVKNKETLALLREDVNLGMEDVGESNALPIIKITTSMSKDNFLGDGSPSVVGRIFHNELKEDFDQLAVNLVYAGQFQLPDFVTKEPKMTYIFGGVLKADNSPFVLFSKGFSLQPTWDFLGEVNNLKRRHQIPMYSLNVLITVGQRSHEKYKNVDVWNFSIERNNNIPVIEQDPGRITFLRDSVLMFKERIEQMINQENNDPVLEQEARDVEEALIK